MLVNPAQRNVMVVTSVREEVVGEEHVHVAQPVADCIRRGFPVEGGGELVFVAAVREGAVGRRLEEYARGLAYPGSPPGSAGEAADV